MNLTLYESLSKKAAHLMPKDRLNPYDYSLYMKILTCLTVEECAEQIRLQGTDWIDFAPSQQGIRPEYVAMAAHIKQHFGVEE
jgi:hypothetical protein